MNNSNGKEHMGKGPAQGIRNISAPFAENGNLGVSFTRRDEDCGAQRLNVKSATKRGRVAVSGKGKRSVHSVVQPSIRREGTPTSCAGRAELCPGDTATTHPTESSLNSSNT